MTLYEAFAALQAEAGGYSAGVRLWMRVMALSFFAGAVFVRWRREALWIALMAAATMVFLILGKSLFPDLSRSLLGSVIHLVLWPAALCATWLPVVRRGRRDDGMPGAWRRVFSAWLIWVTGLVLVSLALDARFLIGAS